METHSQRFKIRLGLFVAGGIAIFVLAIFIIGKQKNLFNPVYKLTSAFYNVSGLQVGNNVRFSGINVGTVDNITIINDSTVRIEMLIRKEIKMFIKSDSKVAIGSEGLIGDRLVIITQGSSGAPLAKEGQALASMEPVETDAIIASLQITAGYAEVIAQQLSEIMLKINSGRGTLGRFIHDTTIADNLNQTIMNLEKTSEGLDETITETKQNISTLMKSMQVTAGNAENFSKELKTGITKINSSNGIFGRLIRDTTMALNIDETIINLRNSSKGLDESIEAVHQTWPLKRYFKRKAKENAIKIKEAEARRTGKL
jgi:phospholipid/cholesterol/gamma-HCH transport system substrate-binding protein